MKSWQFWVLVLVFIFVVVPLIYFAVIARNVAKVVEQPVVIKDNVELDSIRFPKMMLAPGY